MNVQPKPYTFDKVIRAGITLAVIWGLIMLLSFLSDVLIPFAVAFLLAYLINPLVTLLQKKLKSRGLAVFSSLFLILIIGAAACWFLIPLIVNEISHMGKILSDLVTNSDLSKQVSSYLPADIWQALRDWAVRQEVQEFFKTENFLATFEKAAGKVLPGAWGLISGTATFLMSIVGLAVVGLYLVFLLIDYPKVRESWQGLIPARYRQKVVDFVGDFDSGMNRYFRGQAAVASIVGILFALGFWIIGLPLGILLGLLIGLLNMVPYLQIIGLIPAFILAVLHALEIGGSIWVMLGLTGLVFVIVQAFQDAFLVPRIMGKITGLNPAVILLSLSIWGKLLGMFGLIIALPMTCLLLAYYQRYITTTDQQQSTVILKE